MLYSMDFCAVVFFRPAPPRGRGRGRAPQNAARHRSAKYSVVASRSARVRVCALRAGVTKIVYRLGAQNCAGPPSGRRAGGRRPARVHSARPGSRLRAYSRRTGRLKQAAGLRLGAGPRPFVPQDPPMRDATDGRSRRKCSRSPGVVRTGTIASAAPQSLHASQPEVQHPSLAHVLARQCAATRGSLISPHSRAPLSSTGSTGAISAAPL